MSVNLAVFLDDFYIKGIMIRFIKNFLPLLAVVLLVFICWKYMGFTDYFSGRNSILFLKGYFLIALVVFLIGLAITSLFFKRLDALSTIICSIAFGLVVSTGLWAILILAGVPFNDVLFVLINYFIAFFIIYLKRKSLFNFFKMNINSSLLPLVFFYCFFFLGFFFLPIYL